MCDTLCCAVPNLFNLHFVDKVQNCKLLVASQWILLQCPVRWLPCVCVQYETDISPCWGIHMTLVKLRVTVLINCRCCTQTEVCVCVSEHVCQSQFKCYFKLSGTNTLVSSQEIITFWNSEHDSAKYLLCYRHTSLKLLAALSGIPHIARVMVGN